MDQVKLLSVQHGQKNCPVQKRELVNLETPLGNKFFSFTRISYASDGSLVNGCFFSSRKLHFCRTRATYKHFFLTTNNVSRHEQQLHCYDHQQRFKRRCLHYIILTQAQKMYLRNCKVHFTNQSNDVNRVQINESKIL